MISRLSGFLYGIICYSAGMASLVYTGLWLIGLWVPNTLDGMREVNFSQALIIDVVLLLAFSLQHSVMARLKFKKAWTRIIPAYAERSTYVLISAIAFVGLMWLWQPLGITVYQLNSSNAIAAMYGAYAVGWALLVISTFWLNHFDLFGLRQVWLNLRGIEYTNLKFSTPALYKVVRHPLYVGWLLVIWCAPTMTVSHLVFALGTTLYILVAIRFEERDLVEHLPGYEEYQRQVPNKLIPSFRTRATPVKEGI